MSENVGFGAAINRAAAGLPASIRSLLLLNPDATIDAASLARLVDHSVRHPLDLVAPRVLTPEGRVWSAGTDLYLDDGHMRGWRHRDAAADPAGRQPWLSGACLVLGGSSGTGSAGSTRTTSSTGRTSTSPDGCSTAAATWSWTSTPPAVHDAGSTQRTGGRSTRAKSPVYYYFNTRNRLLFAAKHLSRGDQRRWQRSSLLMAYRILLIGGRRQFRHPAATFLPAARGTLAGLVLMRRERRSDRCRAWPRGRARGRRPRRAGHQPGPGLLPGARRDQARPRRLLPLGRRRDRQRAARAALHAAPLPDRRRPATRCTRSGCRRGAPPWMETVRVYFPRWNRTADELCVTELAQVVWAVQMSTVEFHPWNSRRADTEKPDEWRIDLDPGDECGYDTVRRVAHVAHEVLDELGATGFPKTSGGSGLHVYVRIAPDHGFNDVRRAALAFAREVERRTDDVTTTWWRKDRDPREAVRGLQPERPRPHHRGRVLGARQPRGDGSTPVRWDEVDDVEPRDCTIATVPGPLRRDRRPARRHRRRGLRPRPAAGVGRPRRARRRRDPGAGARGLVRSTRRRRARARCPRSDSELRRR